MIEYTLLTTNQASGDNILEVLEKSGTMCHASDFAILHGITTFESKTCDWWTIPEKGEPISGETLYTIGMLGSPARAIWNLNGTTIGIRPAFDYSKIASPLLFQRKNEQGIFEIEYGEYPQTAVDEELSKELETAYKRRKLKETGKKYTTNKHSYRDKLARFEPKSNTEYEYNGKKYIRIIGDVEKGWGIKTLHDGRIVEKGKSYWVEVEPITWIIDKKQSIAVSKQVLYTGIKMLHPFVESYSDFSQTDIYRFLKEHFTKEVTPPKGLTQTVIEQNRALYNNDVETQENQTTRRSRVQKMNPDTSSARQRRKMTDTEIIHSWIESGQSVLLRGPSGIGKTERIRSLYPDLIYIKLTNNMFPEKVVGSVNLQTGESIPPDFAKQAIMSCATEEEKQLIQENIQNLYTLADTIYERSKQSDKKVVILLDELLNVKPAIQSLVYTLVLNRFVESGSGLKLPANTVIVATGNPKKYSSVAEDLAEPLEKRFDHIMDMQPKVSEWIQEYAIPNKVHPAVVGYIISKYIQNYGSETIGEMNYFYEEPEVGEKHLDQNGCKGRTNDPRGWVSISNMLYAFEEDLMNGKFIGKDVESLLQISLGTKLREEWAKEFYDFYNTPTLTVDDVINHNYTEADLPQDTNERFACVTSLLLANEEQVSVCRQFIREHCDPEYLQLFDINWIGKDERRMLIISELQDLDTNDIEGEGRNR